MDSAMTSDPVAATGAVNPAKVRVAVRMRPLIKREKKEGSGRHWDCGSFTVQQVDPKTGQHLPNCLPHLYDHVFGSHIKTEDLYSKIVAPIVEEAFNGFNGTVLCYGQTSSGKTYTLYGDENEPGIISLTAKHIFKRINQDDTRQYFIRVGLLEIYNEKVTDLLNSKNPIDIKEHNGQVYPKDLEEIQIVDAEGMLKAAQRVQRERKIGETRMNKESSRSHTILRISLESIKKDDLTGEEMPNISNAVLNFVDLAGSERVHQTGATGVRLKEAAAINTSLFTLSQVVMQLSEESTDETRRNVPNANTKGSATASSKKPPRHIKFRDSKLTRILQNSLGGNAYIAMICNITPAYLEDTLSTLRFAKAAKKMQTRPQRNKLPVDKSEYEKVIGDLQSQLSSKSVEMESLRKQLAVMSRICKPTPDPLSIGALQQVDRRKTLCPSQLLYNVKRCDSLSIRDNTLDVKTTVSNRALKGVSEIALHSEHKDSFSHASTQKFMTHKETLDHFREVTQSRVMSIDDTLATAVIENIKLEKSSTQEKNEQEIAKRKELTVAMMEKGDSSSKILFLTEELEDTKEKLNVVKAQLTVTKNEFSNVQKEKERMEATKDQEITKLREEIQAKISIVTEVERLRNDVNKKATEIDTPQSELRSKHSELTVAMLERTDSSSKIALLTKQLEEVQENLKAIKLEIATIKDTKLSEHQKIKKLENEIKELQELLQLFRSEVELKNKEIEAVKSEKNSVLEEKQKEILDKTNLKSELDKFRFHVNEKSKEIISLQSKLKLFDSERATALEEKDKSSSQIMQMTRQLQEAQDNMQTMQFEMTTKNTKLSNVLKEKDNKILVMIQQLEELQDFKNSSNTHTRSVLVDRETQTGASIDVMDIIEIKKENRLFAQVCNLEKGEFKCTRKIWDTISKSVQISQQTAFPQIGQTQAIVFPPSGTFNYKVYLAELRSKASQHPSYPPRLNNLRSGRNPPPKHSSEDEKVAVPLSASVGASNSKPSATTTTNFNDEAINPSAWASTLKEMKDTGNDSI